MASMADIRRVDGALAEENTGTPEERMEVIRARAQEAADRRLTQHMERRAS